MISLHFKKHGDSTWQDWSEYVQAVDNLTRKVESEQDGEAGVVVFDEMTISLIMDKAHKNPPYSYFKDDDDSLFTSQDRYMFRLYKHRLVDDPAPLLMFEGMADIASVTYPVVIDSNGDYVTLVRMTVLDKLSALSLLVDISCRTPKVSTDRIFFWKAPNSNDVVFWYEDGRDLSDPGIITPKLGSVIKMFDIAETEAYFLISYYWIPPSSSVSVAFCRGVFVDSSFYEWGRSQGFPVAREENWYADKLYNNTDIYLYEYRSEVFINNGVGNYFETEGYEIVGINAIQIIASLIHYYWSSDTIINRINELDVDGNPLNTLGQNLLIYGGTPKYVVTFPIPIQFYAQTVKKLFEKQPLEALIFLADTMNCYMYYDRQGQFVIQRKEGLAASTSPFTFNHMQALESEKALFWDKLVDTVSVTVWSYQYVEKNSPATGFLDGAGSASIVEGMTARNELQKNVFLELSTVITGSTLEERIQQVNDYATIRAQKILDFYGKRHNRYSITLVCDYTAYELDLLADILFRSKRYFTTAVSFDFDAGTLSFEMVSRDGYLYNPTTVIFNKQDAFTGGMDNSVSGASGDSGGSILGNPFLWSGTSIMLDQSMARSSLNISNVENIAISTWAGSANLITLGTITTGVWSATIIKPDKGGTGVANHADSLITITGGASPTLSINNGEGQTKTLVNQDRTISTTSPLAGGGNLGANLTLSLGYVAPLKLTGATLDIDISAPIIKSANKLTLGIGDGLTTSGNNLTISYEDNLKITATKLNTIQDIKTTSKPQFAGLAIGAALTTGADIQINTDVDLYAGKYIGSRNFVSGFAGAGWKVSYENSAYTAHFDNLFIRGAFTVYELIINQIRATNGSLWVSSSAKIRAISGNDITFESTNNTCPFVTDDIIMCQRLSINAATTLKLIVRKIVSVSNNSVVVTTLAGAPADTGSLAIGDELVRIGNVSNLSRQGAVYLTADDSSAPFIDVYDNVKSWADFKTYDKTKCRIGRLEGITDPVFGVLQGYGIFTQNAYLTNANIKGNINAGNKFFAGNLYRNMFKYSEGNYNGTEASFALSYYGSGVNNGKVSALNPFGSFVWIQTFRGSEASGNNYIILKADSNRVFSSLINQSGKTFTVSFWVKATGAGVCGNHTLRVEYPDGTLLSNAVVFNVTTSWKRVIFTFTLPTGISSDYLKVYFIAINHATDSYYLYGYQLEEGYSVTEYQKTENVNNILDFGMWCILGGFGGTIQSPCVAITTEGIVIRKNDATELSFLADNTISMGFSGATWGIIGKSGSNNVFELGSTNKIAGWSFDNAKLYNGDIRIESSASLKGLAVAVSGTDVLKVGGFADLTPSVTTSDISSTWLDLSFEDGGMTDWSLTGSSVNIDKNSFPQRCTLPSYTASGSNSGYSYLSRQIDISAYAGKGLRLTSYVGKITAGQGNRDKIHIAVYELGGTLVYFKNVDVSSTGVTITFDYDVPVGITDLYIVASFWGATSGVISAYYFSGFFISTFTNPQQVLLNDDGLLIYKNANSLVKITQNEVSFKVPTMQVKTIDLGNGWTLSTQYASDGGVYKTAVVLKYQGASKQVWWDS